jgi:drug/metabolite transporter (DMT)-like permease
MEKMISSTKVTSAMFIVIYALVIINMMGQYISIPLFISSLDGTAGAYFIISWLGFLNNLVFWSLTAIRYKQGKLTKNMWEYTKTNHKLFITLGLFNALNGLLVFYSSGLSRTPGSLQAILSCSNIPFTVLLSKLLLKKTYTSQQLLGVFITITGIVVSMIPVFNGFSTSDVVSIIFPILYLIGQLTIVIQNILQEKIFMDCHNYDSVLLNAWASLYQITITTVFLTWVDIIPGFGVSKDLADFVDKYKNGLTCFFAPWSPDVSPKCSYCALLGVIFLLTYCLASIYIAELMKYASANTTAIISAFSPTVMIFFWILFPSVNDWASGAKYTTLDIICDTIAIPIIVTGIFTFRISESKKIKEIVMSHLIGKDESDTFE